MASGAQRVIVRENKTNKILFFAAPGGRPAVELWIIKFSLRKKFMACRMRVGQYEKTREHGPGDLHAVKICPSEEEN
jgi:hypothetical protein